MKDLKLYTKTLDLFVYGISNHTLNIRIVDMDQLGVVHAINDIVENVATYLTKKVKLNVRNLYIYLSVSDKREFLHLHEFKIGTDQVEKDKDQNFELMIFFSEIDVTLNQNLQSYICSLSMNEKTVDETPIEKNSLLFSTNTKSESNQQFSSSEK